MRLRAAVRGQGVRSGRLRGLLRRLSCRHRVRRGSVRLRAPMRGQTVRPRRLRQLLRRLRRARPLHSRRPLCRARRGNARDRRRSLGRRQLRCRNRGPRGERERLRLPERSEPRACRPRLGASASTAQPPARPLIGRHRNPSRRPLATDPRLFRSRPEATDLRTRMPNGSQRPGQAQGRRHSGRRLPIRRPPPKLDFRDGRTAAPGPAPVAQEFGGPRRRFTSWHR